jgi:hypothetical protein
MKFSDFHLMDRVLLVICAIVAIVALINARLGSPWF